MARTFRFFRAGALLAICTLFAGACATSGDDIAAETSEAPGADPAEPTTEAAGSEAGGGGEVTVGSANFPEQLILGNMYADVLEEAGLTVERNLNLGSREVYFPALVNGDIDVLPEYLGSTYNFLAEGEAQVLTEVDQLRSELETTLPEELTLLESSAAQDQDALAVTQETADEFGLVTVSDLAPVAGELVAGGPAEEETRATGLPGLAEVYDIEFSEYVVLDAGGPLTREALTAGRVDVGRVFSTSAFVEADGLVVLEEDQPLIPAENVTPIVRAEVVTPELEEALNELSAALTTEDLTALNARVEIDQEEPDVVANEYLVEQGLVDG